MLHVDSENVEIIPSRTHPDRGTVVARGETRNQRGEVRSDHQGLADRRGTEMSTASGWGRRTALPP
ncbi:hypothetical protein [Bradyrhizobium sp. 33ap4]|uniref:hypothetical protein n=1 Tax=Bradyrhizobium sp. 33ap4 TaxID=3061630 RepID=UPI0029310385|nr:hypothetical protein [Bradyrhizobium sp. 33ap4]